MSELSYDPQILFTKDMVDAYWPYIFPMLDRCVQRTAHGTMETNDIYHAAIAGKVFLFVVKADTPDGPAVKLVLALEPSEYPRLLAYNIFAVGGNELLLCHDKYWKHLCGWAYMVGARAIEANVSPAMERIVSRFGFKRTHIQVRYDLKGN